MRASTEARSDANVNFGEHVTNELRTLQDGFYAKM